VKRLPDFAGAYELAAGETRIVSVVDNELFVERNGKREQLFSESCEVFFRKGVEGRVLFRADAKWMH
jgi:hypothetical protein